MPRPIERLAVAQRLLVLALCSWGAASWGQAPAAPSAGIYTCIDDKGRRITADRPIPECIDREQQVLNRDGSVRTVVPPHADGRRTRRARGARACSRRGPRRADRRRAARPQSDGALPQRSGAQPCPRGGAGHGAPGHAGDRVPPQAARRGRQAAARRSRVLPGQAAADQAQGGHRRQRGGRRGTACGQRQPGSRARPHQPALRRGARTPAPAVGGHGARFAGAARSQRCGRRSARRGAEAKPP